MPHSFSFSIICLWLDHLQINSLITHHSHLSNSIVRLFLHIIVKITLFYISLFLCNADIRPVARIYVEASLTRMGCHFSICFLVPFLHVFVRSFYMFFYHTRLYVIHWYSVYFYSLLESCQCRNINLMIWCFCTDLTRMYAHARVCMEWDYYYP